MIYLCKTTSIAPNKSAKFTIDDTALFVINKEDNFYAYLNMCPHRSISLDWDNNKFLDPDNELIECATHGALFAIDSGLCVSGPCVGQNLSKVKLNIQQQKIYWDKAN